MPAELPSFIIAQIQQGARIIPLRFCSIMTQQHQTVAVLYQDLVTLESIAVFKRPVSDDLNTVVMKRWAWSASVLG